LAASGAQGLAGSDLLVATGNEIKVEPRGRATRRFPFLRRSRASLPSIARSTITARGMEGEFIIE